MAMPMDMAFGRQNAEILSRAGSLLFGATTFRGMRGYWPHQVDNPAASDDDRSIAGRFAAGIPITVVSDTLTPEETEPWSAHKTIVPCDQTRDTIAHLRQQSEDTLIFGSRTLWSSLLAQGLVDELHLMVGPRTVTGDRPAFEGVPPTSPRLMVVSRLAGSELVLLSYAVPPTN
jgi:dihydrofolate reductase